MGFRLNPPPGWPPLPPGFVPPAGWRPDPAWPAPPPGWQFWVPDDDDALSPPPGNLAASRGSAQHSSHAQHSSQPYSPQQYSSQQHSPQQHGSQQYSSPSQGSAQYGSQPPAGQQYPPQPYGGQPYSPYQSQALPSYTAPSAPAETTCGAAIASLVLGILGFLTIPAVLGLIFGIVALGRIRSTGQRGKGLAIAGIVVSSIWIAAFVSLIAIGVANGGGNAQRSTSTGQISRKGSENVFSLRVGDCFNNPPGTTMNLSSVTAIPCTQPHNAQVFAAFNTTGGNFPGSAALEQRATTGCNARIATSLDRQKILSSMSIHFIFPEVLSWDTGQRKINCLIVNSSADLKSSVLTTQSPAAG